MNLEMSTMGGGCFWCIEAVLQRLKGVEKIESGYCGGKVPGKPTYREVCSGLTGHAEVVQVTFDSDQLSFADLVRVFMTIHDPTSLNRQGGDVGTQYRSVIFYHSEQQKETITRVFEELKPYFSRPIVTEVSEIKPFYSAEKEHQDYYNLNSNAPYCRAVIEPKISKLRTHYADKLKQINY